MNFFLFFAKQSLSTKPPVVLVPPMFGSVLYGNVYDLDSHWYCSKNKEDEFLWIQDTYLIPPLVNCLATWLTVQWNETSQKPVSREKTEIYTIDFGGLSAIRYVDHGILGHHFIPDLIHLITKLEDEGYVEKTDLFGAPYDWRMNPVSVEDFYTQLKALIEQVYESCGNQKVTMYGISAGGMTTHNFLTTFVTQEWKDKYIKKIILHGPSYGGAGEALEAVWDQTIPFLPGVYQTDDVNELTLTVPTLHAHLPNWNLNGDITFMIGPDGTEYKAKDLPDLILDHNKIPDEDRKIWDASMPYVKREIVPPGVPTYILFNSVLDTPQGWNFANGWDEEGTLLYSKGDGTLSKESLYYACDNWDSNYPTLCHDLEINDTQYSHAGQLVMDDVQEILYQAILDDSWIVKGKHLIKGNTTQPWKTLKPN